MNADDLLLEAISEAVDETLADWRINPYEEVERLQLLIESMFWGTYQERKVEEQEP